MVLFVVCMCTFCSVCVVCVVYVVCMMHVWHMCGVCVAYVWLMCTVYVVYVWCVWCDCGVSVFGMFLMYMGNICAVSIDVFGAFEVCVCVAYVCCVSGV